ncbi:MAG TPA: pyrimidine/purine nucleoside phosphorylase [Fibrobacteraceae bacterium]|nr:pyrimidine/purine nucleoside phosphorylase [Fibrobacteraceae bacterium]
MIKVNEYFQGTVKSLGFENSKGRQTVGVMAAGDYEFGTGAPERMTLIAGRWSLQLPGESTFREYAIGQTVSIPGNSKFKLEIAEDSAYFCEYAG